MLEQFILKENGKTITLPIYPVTTVSKAATSYAESPRNTSPILLIESINIAKLKTLHSKLLNTRESTEEYNQTKANYHQLVAQHNAVLKQIRELNETQGELKNSIDLLERANARNLSRRIVARIHDIYAKIDKIAENAEALRPTLIDLEEKLEQEKPNIAPPDTIEAQTVVDELLWLQYVSSSQQPNLEVSMRYTVDPDTVHFIYRFESLDERERFIQENLGSTAILTSLSEHLEQLKQTGTLSSLATHYASIERGKYTIECIKPHGIALAQTQREFKDSADKLQDHLLTIAMDKGEQREVALSMVGQALYPEKTIDSLSVEQQAHVALDLFTRGYPRLAFSVIAELPKQKIDLTRIDANNNSLLDYVIAHNPNYAPIVNNWIETDCALCYSQHTFLSICQTDFALAKRLWEIDPSAVATSSDAEGYNILFFALRADPHAKDDFVETLVSQGMTITVPSQAYKRLYPGECARIYFANPLLQMYATNRDKVIMRLRDDLSSQTPRLFTRPGEKSAFLGLINLVISHEDTEALDLLQQCDLFETLNEYLYLSMLSCQAKSKPGGEIAELYNDLQQARHDQAYQAAWQAGYEARINKHLENIQAKLFLEIQDVMSDGVSESAASLDSEPDSAASHASESGSVASHDGEDASQASLTDVIDSDAPSEATDPATLLTQEEYDAAYQAGWEQADRELQLPADTEDADSDIEPAPADRSKIDEESQNLLDALKEQIDAGLIEDLTAGQADPEISTLLTTFGVTANKPGTPDRPEEAAEVTRSRSPSPTSSTIES